MSERETITRRRPARLLTRVLGWGGLGLLAITGAGVLYIVLVTIGR